MRAPQVDVEVDFLRFSRLSDDDDDGGGNTRPQQRRKGTGRS